MKKEQTEAQKKHAAYMRAWRASHPEYTQIYMRGYLQKYNERNRDRLRASHAKWYRENKKKHLSRCKVWRSDPANKEKVRQNLRLRRSENLQIILSAKNSPCVDCGRVFESRKMHFDHVRGERMFHLGHRASKSYSAATILKEIDKCEIRCASCHARRHSENKKAGRHWDAPPSPQKRPK